MYRVFFVEETTEVLLEGFQILDTTRYHVSKDVILCDINCAKLLIEGGVANLEPKISLIGAKLNRQ